MYQSRRGIPAVLWVVIVLAGFGIVLWLNIQSTNDEPPPNNFIIPTEVVLADNRNAWQEIVREGFGDNSTPLPTIELPEEEFVPPTLDRGSDTGVIQLEPAQIGPQGPPTPFDGAVPPTPLPPTQNAVDSEQGVVVTVIAVTGTAVVWQPPPLAPPLSRDPLGRDHYWLRRPVDSNANNADLFYYPFGSDGPERENPWRIHHGIDMPNPIGQTVRAAGAGTVVWAADGLRVEEEGFFQNTPSYGNVIVIEHDFGYRGEAIYTLYAHLSGVLVQRGQQVNAGEAIGLVGDSGRVSGPHLHFEVRLGSNAYAETVNPLLWMVPYVGHGVIAGRVTDFNGGPLPDHVVTIRDWRTGLVADATTTYILADTGFDVNPDPEWQETFVVTDLPVGRYEVITSVSGRRLTKIIDVQEGMTTFVELIPEDIATPQAVVGDVDDEG